MPDDFRYVEDHAARAVGLLVSQFDDAEKLRAFVRALVMEAQEVEDAFNDLVNLRWLDTAEGEQLDGLGEILNESRMGRGDTDYRQALRFRIFVNTSEATPETIVSALRLLLDPDLIWYRDLFPANFQTFVQVDDTLIDQDFVDLIQSLAPAAVGNVSLTYNTELPFIFSGQEPETPDFELSDGSLLELVVDGEDDSVLQLSILAEQAEDPEEGGGFAEIQAFDLELSDGSLLEVVVDGEEFILSVNDFTETEEFEDEYGAWSEVWQTEQEEVA